MNAQDNIGRLLDYTAKRDAVHIALAPMTAGDRLYPGEKVMLAAGTTDTILLARDRNPIGIVDPFLKDDVSKGDRCWVFLTPGSITGMRHEWQHPVLDAERPQLSPSEAWLRRFADQWNFDYDDLIAKASMAYTKRNAWDWHGVVAHGVDLHSRYELGDDEALFWEHLGTLTGKVYDEEHRDNFGWSCSC